MATRLDNTRIIRAPHGSTIRAKSWLTEAPLRMLMNNLDPEVAEKPHELVVYGGIGRAARDWESFDRIVVVAARARSRRDPVRAVRQAGRHLPHPCGRAARADRQLQHRAALGDARPFQRARSQGPDDVRPDDRGLVDLYRLAGHRAGHLRDLRRGRPPPLRRQPRRADGFSPPVSAAWAARSRSPRPWRAPRCWRSSASPRASRCGCAPAISTSRRSILDEALDHDRARRARRRRPVSVGVLGNAAEMLPELVRRGVQARRRDRPDLGARSDQRLSARRLDPGRMAGAARARSERRRARREGIDGGACARDARFLARRRAGGRLRQQHPPDGAGDGRRRMRSNFPASCRLTSVRCSAAASGRSAGPRCRAIRRTSTAPMQR